MALQEQYSIGQLYRLADQCSHDYPVTLAKKIEILTEVQVLLGRKAAEAVREYKRTYAQRKRHYAEAYLAATKDKAQHAELAVTDLRMQEADLEADKVRWSHAFESNGEVINSLKYSLKVLLAEYQNPANGVR
ncbi:hypothetical protein [Paenibacillus radicis (ex Xue et al. 2023)]|uniref:Uncharacterized protein n=1 Tax=Paenibacillus radicis (ex Xue et al. 2023) TaxID=2972489 RepID=A0ABT1YL63_9BACL|nr:hypothetical protein [Paenibacillus radicis (ex Xue et al. 2023)]MCR8633455.1 hypothetical protein [Paenibacillus radicis (ex Xue et al. 2023)]